MVPSFLHSFFAHLTVFCLCINKSQEDFRPLSISEGARFVLNMESQL